MPETEVITNFVPRVKLKDQTAAYKIWHHRFLCEVEQMHLYDKKYLEQFGFVNSGDVNINRQMAKSKVCVQLTIAAMAMLHADGVSMRLVEPQDSVRIYKYIYDHLMDWQVQLRENVYINKAPVEDLRKLDDLAGEVYQVAKFYWNNKPYHGGFFQFLDTKQRGGARQLLPVAKAKVASDAAHAKHASMVETIDQDLSRRNVPWR